MFPISGISIFLLFTAIWSQFTESSAPFSIFKNRGKGFDPLNINSFKLKGRSGGEPVKDASPPRIKANSTRIMLFDRTKEKWVYLPQSVDRWNQNGELKMIIHGFNPMTMLSGIPALKAHHILILGQEYVRKNSSINVVIVDWMPLATRPANQYGQAAASTRSVGTFLTDKLLGWKKEGIIPNWKAVHILGFSLGGHVAGMMGYQILERTGKKIGRITGLDPAGPGFSDDGEWPDDRSEFLDYTDAHFVDIVHCNMGTGGEFVSGLQGTFGSAVQAGHVDFYPNGGSHQKPACDTNQDRLGCSHMYCVMLMAAGVKNPLQFPMCPCPSWDTYLEGSCDCLTSGSSEALCVGDEAITQGGPKLQGYYSAITDKINPDYFQASMDDDVEFF